jgi:hypothetical protein
MTDDELLRRLEERLVRASESAERLLAEAGAQAAARVAGRQPSAEGVGDAPAADRPPPAGWQAPSAEDPLGPGDLELLSQVIRSVRDLIPPDLERRLLEALRELLLAVRAVIDWYVERLDRRRAEPAAVEDIPIS